MTAVLRLRDPMPGVRPYQETARHMHALQRAPILQSIADRHAEVALADAEQHRRLPVGRVGDRALVAPYGTSSPGRSAIGELASVIGVADAPLGGQVNLAGVADDALVTGGGGLDPVSQVSAVARARGT